jgi:uncharacterized protein
MAKDFDPHRLDVRRFAEEGVVLQADAELRLFVRLSADTADADPQLPVHWHARGELLNPHHHAPEVWPHLQADAILPLVCQRCLTPVQLPVAVDRSFRSWRRHRRRPGRRSRGRICWRFRAASTCWNWWRTNC